MNKKFLELMRNRLIMGRFRYGPMPGKLNYDSRTDLIGRIDKYYHTNNMEWLVDIGNMALLAWLNPYRPAFVHNQLHDRLVGGLLESVPPVTKLYQTEQCPEFERLMVAAYPIIAADIAAWVDFDVDRRTYPEIAAIAWYEFNDPLLPNAHWSPVDRG